MKASLEIVTDNPEQLEAAVGPSLRDHKNVEYNYESQQQLFKVNVKTEGLGPLRGATDSAFRLLSLSQRLSKVN